MNDNCGINSKGVYARVGISIPTFVESMSLELRLHDTKLFRRANIYAVCRETKRKLEPQPLWAFVFFVPLFCPLYNCCALELNEDFILLCSPDKLQYTHLSPILVSYFFVCVRW